MTQFLTDDSGSLSEIKRFYVQDGKTIGNAESDMTGVSGNSITDDYCTAQKAATNSTNYFTQKGGWDSMTTAMSNGMVLVMSLWDDVSDGLSPFLDFYYNFPSHLKKKKKWIFWTNICRFFLALRQHAVA